MIISGLDICLFLRDSDESETRVVVTFELREIDIAGGIYGGTYINRAFKVQAFEKCSGLVYRDRKDLNTIRSYLDEFICGQL